jgi:hypothetical protein
MLRVETNIRLRLVLHTVVLSVVARSRVKKVESDRSAQWSCDANRCAMC